MGKSAKRKKKPSKKYRDDFGHTPPSIEEEIPWKCRRQVIGTGTGKLPVIKEVKRNAQRRKIKLFIVPMARTIEELQQSVEPQAVLAFQVESSALYCRRRSARDFTSGKWAAVDVRVRDSTTPRPDDGIKFPSRNPAR